MLLPITLTSAGAAAIINFWLAMRIGRVRTKHKIFMGDNGHEGLVAAMRAQANFVENAPFVLILIGFIELASGPRTWLWIVAAVFLLGRVAHGLGMTGAFAKGRTIGTIITFLTLLGLGAYAIALPFTTVAVVTPAKVMRGN